MVASKDSTALVVAVSLVAALGLHSASSTYGSTHSSGGGILAPWVFGPPQAPAGDTREVASLLERRSGLVAEIAQLQHAVKELEKVKGSLLELLAAYSSRAPTPPRSDGLGFGHQRAAL